jgi:sensor domain CHASE-containing protein
MANNKKVNWNTLILTVGFTFVGWIGKESYAEMRITHDAVLVIKSQMVSHSEFDLQISDVRSRLSSVEVEIQKLKEHRP